MLEIVVELRSESVEVSKPKADKCDRDALQKDFVRDDFVRRYRDLEAEARAGTQSHDLDAIIEALCSSLHQAAAETLPKVEVAPQKPWIGTGTLDIIAQRNEAKKRGDRTINKSAFPLKMIEQFGSETL